MFLYDENKLLKLERALRLPLLVGTLYLSYQAFPFLFYMFGGISSSRPGWFLWLFSTSALLLAHFLADECCCHIRHAVPKLFTRALLLVLGIPLGVLMSLLWPLLLLAAMGMYVVFWVMDVLK